MTTLGAPAAEALAAVSDELGPPEEDPASAVRCINVDREVQWPELVLAVEDDRLVGWSTASPDLQSPSGVRVGTDVPRLRSVYGTDIRFREANPDNPPTFEVDSVDFLGSLSSSEDDGEVTTLFTSECAGP